VNTAIDRFLDYLVFERGLSANTREAYGNDLETLRDYLASQKITEPLQVEREHVLEFLAAEDRRGLAPASLSRRLVAIKVFFAHEVEEGRLVENPTAHLETPTLWQTLPGWLTHDEVEQLLASPAGGTREGTRDRAILELFYATGLRVSELAGLQLDQLFLDEAYVRVLGKGGKVRVVPVGSHAIEALRHYLVEGRPLFQPDIADRSVFISRIGRGLSRVGVWRIVTSHARRAGIEKHLTPHTLRHSFASHLLENGAPLRVIQEMLGHADVATTQIYTHVDQKRLLSLHRQFHPRA